MASRARRAFIDESFRRGPGEHGYYFLGAVIVPDAHVVELTGRLRAHLPSGMRRWHWREEGAGSRRRFTALVAEFAAPGVEAVVCCQVTASQRKGEQAPCSRRWPMARASDDVNGHRIHLAVVVHGYHFVHVMVVIAWQMGSLMKQGEVQQLLTTTNRWWRNPSGWAADDPDLREADEAPFAYSPEVLDNLTAGGLYVLRGPRRVGKSVQIKRTIRSLIDNDRVEPRRILHVSVDGWRAGNLGLLIEAAKQLLPADGQRWWFIDEITSITDGWPERIKWLRDNDARFRTDTVVLTGSSAANLTASVKALADRRGKAADPDRVLLPMGFRTFAGLLATDPLPDDVPRLRLADLTTANLAVAADALVPWLGQLVATWEAYLQVGGFPRAVASYLSAREPDEALQRGLLDVVHGDAFANADWSRTQTVAFLARLTDGLASPTNHTSIAETIDSSPPTVSRRLDDLREAFIVWPAYREDALKPKLRAQEKVYFTDPIYTQLAPGARLDLTALSEQQLGMALLRGLEHDVPGSYTDFARVLHHRTSTRKEIDFVGPDFGGAAIESKYVDGRWRGEAQTLQASRWRGIVATRTELNLDDPQVVAVPTALLAWLVDV